MSLFAVYKIHRRYLTEGLKHALTEKARPGQPPKQDLRQQAEITLLACSKGPAGHARWRIRRAIALFSHFISCGVWEALYLLDSLLKNLSDIQPDTIHGDSQAQSTPVFGLASLRGIRVMPHSRNWKDLTLYRPDKQASFTHIAPLFSDTIDWPLIQSATNKSDAFNGFAQWVAFGGDGTVATNDRDEQRKLTKYNHLVANCVIFHKVFSLSRVLHDLQSKGYSLETGEVAWAPSGNSPYVTQPINRFGRSDLDVEQ